MPLKRISYKAGEVSIVRLPDQTKLWIETLPRAVRLKRVRLGMFPGGTVWVFNFPFYIRTAAGAWNLSREILDLVLASLDTVPPAPA